MSVCTEPTMAISLAMKRGADSLLDATSNPSSIECSPVKQLLSTAFQGPLAKKHKGDFPFSTNMDFMTGAADLEASVRLAEGKENQTQETSLAKATDIGLLKPSSEDRDCPMSPPGNRSFPCVWLGNGGEEPSDKPPQQPMPASLPPEGIEGPMPPPASSTGSMIVPSTETPLANSPPRANQAPFFDTAKSPFLPEKSMMAAGPLPTGKSPPSPINSLHPNMKDLHVNGMVRHSMDAMGLPLPRGMTSTPESITTTGSDGEPLEVCPECHKVFKRKVYLQRHMEREHWSTAKVFKCEDCNYETKHQSNLSVHRRTHTGERPYHCGACGQRYTQGHLLKSHIRSRHGGNMEFYNLDKKSDSTRGRKSLDAKHDSLFGHHKQDKISALLQAANNVSPQNPGQPQSPLGGPKFGNLLSPAMGNFMGSLSPYLNPLRPMLGNPLSMAGAGGLLGGPRFFNMGGLPANFPHLPNNLLNSVQQNILMNGGHGLIPPNPATSLPANIKKELSPIKSENDMSGLGIKLPLKVPDIILPPATAATQTHQSPKGSLGDEPHAHSPQDLSKRQHDEHEAFGSLQNHLHFLSQSKLSEREPEDLSQKMAMEALAKAMHSSARQMMAPNNQGPLYSQANSLVTTVPSYVSTPSPLTQEEDSQDESFSEGNDDAAVLEREQNELLRDVYMPAAAKGLSLARGKCNPCLTTTCPHLKKLKDLRKNIFRVLSTFTPDLALENIIDYETDEVDEILYDVIYCNLEEECVTKND